MKKRSPLNVLAGLAAVSFALSATAYLTLKEHENANPEPIEPTVSATDEVQQPQVVAQEIEAEPLLDEQGFPLQPNVNDTFMFSSKSLVIPVETFDTEELPDPDVFLPSSKVRFINTKALVKPTQENETQPVEN